MSILPESMPVWHMHIVPTKARRGCSDPLSPEVQLPVKPPVDSENETQVLCKGSHGSSLLNRLSSPTETKNILKSNLKLFTAEGFCHGLSP